MWIQNSPSLPSTKELNQITVRTPNTKFLYLMLTFPSCLHHSTSFWRCLTQNNSSSTLCGRHPALYKLLENIKVVQGEVYFFYIIYLHWKKKNKTLLRITIRWREEVLQRTEVVVHIVIVLSRIGVWWESAWNQIFHTYSLPSFICHRFCFRPYPFCFPVYWLTPVYSYEMLFFISALFYLSKSFFVYGS